MGAKLDDGIVAKIRAGELPAAVPAPWHRLRAFWECYLCGEAKPAAYVELHLAHSHGLAVERRETPEHAVSRVALYAKPGNPGGEGKAAQEPPSPT